MLKVGDKLKQMEVTLQDDSKITIPEFGKKYVIFFYPKDNTPGCTAEACSIRDSYKELQDKGYEIYGVSIDSPKSHIKFIDKFDLPFPLISDEDKKVVEAFGVWALKKFMGREYMGTLRTTFIIDESGTISHVIEKVKTKEAADQILKLI